MLSLILKIHTIIRAYFVRYFVVRSALKTYHEAHRQELSQTPVYNLPITLARQQKELAAIRAGNIPSIVDRKSWQWPWLPASINRLSQPLIKNTPYNLRRLSRSPVARRAINLIKGAVISQPWAVQPLSSVPSKDDDDQKSRIEVATKIFRHPNNIDSFQTYVEQGLEDFLCFGAFVAELGYTLDPERPLKSWPVNVESIRLFPSWSESTPDQPKFAQMTGLKGERGALLFYNDDMMYIKDNPSTDTPFGTGKMEIAFSVVNWLLGVQQMSGMAGSDQVHKCFPEDTEVLTKRGWLLWRDTTEDDEFATRSIDGQFQWQHAIGFVKEQHDGDLIQFKNRGLHITVTPNHRMYGWKFRHVNGKKVAEELGFVEAHELYDEVVARPGKGWRLGRGGDVKSLFLSDFRIPTRTIWQDGTLPSPKCILGDKIFRWKDWAAFLGIWIAEGSCLGSGMAKAPRGDYRIQIAQSRQANRAKYKQIDKLLCRMGIYYQRKYDRFIFVDKDIWAYVSTLGNSFTKSVPQWIKDAPPHIIRTFVDWAVMGNGSVVGVKGKRVYYTVSKKLAGDMQELFQKIGSSAAVREYQDGDSLMYAVDEMLRETISIVPDKGRGKARMPKRIPYSGYVYCAMVPNGTLYCREKGYAFWSGNTWLWWEQPQSVSAYQTVRRHIQNELEGQAKISIIGGVKKPDVIEVKPVNIEDLLLEWQEMLIRMIANAFDMSAMSLNITNDVNRAVGQVLDDKDFRSAIVPVAKRLQEAFTRKIIHESLHWNDLEFVFLSLDDPDIETKLNIYKGLYSVNASTPNRILKAMNMPLLDTPLADLTQFEAMILMQEVTTMQQDALADHATNRQMAVQDYQQQQQSQMMPQQPPQGPNNRPGGSLPPSTPKALPPAGGKGAPSGGNSGGRNGMPPSPKALALPKFPISGSAHAAREIAQMPVNKITDLITTSGMTAVQLLAAMEESDPGVLEMLEEEVREFLEQRVQEEMKNGPKAIPPKVLNQWLVELKKKYKMQNSRTLDLATYLNKYKNMGKPGKAGQAGKPGKYPTGLGGGRTAV